MNIFTQLNREHGITILLVTHELDIARYARRLVRFLDGRIIHDGEIPA
jgi:putative ABC transport system ATP-binding protein